MASWDPRVNEIFLKAIEAPLAGERGAVLDKECQSDSELRRKVEALLQAHDRAGSFLEEAAPVLAEPEPAATIAGTQTRAGNGTSPGGTSAGFHVDTELERPARMATRPVLEGPGSRIGPYKLLQKIGEGGMGSVYMAEQEVPVRRRVALKIIKPGMDSEQVIRRFEAERQALALMDHPAIARVLDAGATDSGRPYFVMELVNGMPITEYCDQQQLEPRQRLDLFTRVCAAVQHAHQKGIIHRDLKPSNVLVTLIDGQPAPKVIDFGVAKAIDQRLTERTLFTQFGGIVGTLEYMSPEQAALSGVDIDTRSDIYSLGVLIYELLTGTTPLTRGRLQESAYLEILRRIREEEPPPPSSRLSQSAETLPSISAQRRTEPERLRRLVRGELDWIVMKALDKDRSRRYETASGLARDIERYLGDEPVEAGPLSTRYRLTKLLRKHRVLVATSAAFAGLLLLGALVSLYLAVRATRAERAAQDALIHARQAEEAARDERDKARAAEAQSKAVSEFLQNDLLSQASARSQVGRGSPPDPDVKVRTVLDRAAAKIESRFADQPLVEASTRQIIGRTYRDLGLYAEAVPHLKRSIELHQRLRGEADPAALRAMEQLAWSDQALNRFAEAEALTRKVLEEIGRQKGSDHEETLGAKNDLAVLFIRQGKYAEGEALLLECYQARVRISGEDHPHSLELMNNLGLLRKLQGRNEEARKLLERCLEIRRRVSGDSHPDTLNVMNNLGFVYQELGKAEQAEAMLKAALELSRKSLGNDHDQTVQTMNALAGAYWKQARFEESEALLSQVMESRTRQYGEGNLNTIAALYNLGLVRRSSGKAAEARAIFEKVLALRRGVQGEAHPETLEVANDLSFTLAVAPDPKDRDLARASALLDETIPRLPQGLETFAGNLWNTRSLVQLRAGDPKAALESALRANALHHDQSGEDWLLLALAHARLGDREQARGWYDRALPWLSRNRSGDQDFRRLQAEAASLLGLEPPAAPQAQPKSPVRG
jgi:non-specific serine/threonine protein kinase/serine/threonine-protein kinase